MSAGGDLMNLDRESYDRLMAQAQPYLADERLYPLWMLGGTHADPSGKPPVDWLAINRECSE